MWLKTWLTFVTKMFLKSVKIYKTPLSHLSSANKPRWKPQSIVRTISLLNQKWKLPLDVLPLKPTCMTIFFQTDTNGVTLKNALALSVFIIAVNLAWDFDLRDVGQRLQWEYASLLRTKFCLQKRKTSLLLAYIEILWQFSLQILVLYF